LIAIALPSTYVIARSRQDVTRVRELLEQSRIGEAATVAHRLRRLAPGSQVGGQPITRLTADVDRSVRRLLASVAVLPEVNTSDDDWLQRARQLAMLGQTDAALQALAEIRVPRPDASNLSGTIHENRENWQEALVDYSEARKQWNSKPISRDREAGRIQALTGIAYCLRKQGRYPEAEQTYQQLLALSPNANVHFLLAQFYEDTQQTSLAKEHAQQAMALAPDRFEQRGRRLINKLATTHFGCIKMLPGQSDE
jgi:tetratricopeptide (TPR) repeat protein